MQLHHSHRPIFQSYICSLGVKNQRLISRCLNAGHVEEARQLHRIDDQLALLLLSCKEAEPMSEEAQRASGITHYIWRTQDDAKVRPSHAANNGKIFAWDEPPPTGHPGADYNCRCWAEPLKEGIEPVYPIEEAITLLVGGGVARRIGREAVRRVIESERESSPSGAKPRLDDTKTWPQPPKAGRYKQGLPSRMKPQSRGEKSLYDENGGEWRYSPEDKYHNPHWDYKPAGQDQQWQNIPIDDLSVIK